MAIDRCSRARSSRRCAGRRSVFTDAYAALPDIDLRVDGRMMAVTLVTGNFFQVVGVNPVMGRALAPADDESGGNPVIVLSDKGWEPPLQSRSERAGTDRARQRRAVRDHRRDAGGVPRPRGQRA